MAMLGIDNYLCEACANFNTDGIDGNHPFCQKQHNRPSPHKAVRVGESCPFGYESGIPSGYPVSIPRNRERAAKILSMLRELGIEVSDASGTG